MVVTTQGDDEEESTASEEEEEEVPVSEVLHPKPKRKASVAQRQTRLTRASAGGRKLRDRSTGRGDNAGTDSGRTKRPRTR